MGMFTILTKPLGEKDIFITRVKRPLENLIIKKYVQKVKKESETQKCTLMIYISYIMLHLQ